MKSMNSLERLFATLQGQPVDRVPVLAVTGAWGGLELGVPMARLYREPDLWVQAQLAIHQRHGLDMVLAPFDFSTIAEAWGGQVVWHPDQPPAVRKPVVTDPRQALDLPRPPMGGRLAFVRDSAAALSARCQGQVACFAVVPGPFSLPALVLGLESWLDTVLFDWPLAQALLDKFCPYWVWWAQELVAAGVTGLVVPEGMAARDISDRALFESRIRPVVQQCFAQVAAPLVFHHTGGSIGHIVDILPGLPNLAGVSIGARDSLPACRQHLGTGLLLMGNLDNLAFHTRSPEEIYTRARTCLAQVAGQGPYALANSGGDIPLTARPEHLQALLRAATDHAAAVAAGVLADPAGPAPADPAAAGGEPRHG